MKSRPTCPTAWRLLACCLILALGGLPSRRGDAQELELAGDFLAHDPSTPIKDGDYYYIFYSGDGIPCKRSPDLRTWAAVSAVYPADPPAWTTRGEQTFTNDFWAPDVIHINGLYYLYYSASEYGSQNSAIGLTTSPTLDPASPDYHWTDRGIVIRSRAGGSPYNCIDPSAFQDADGSLWLAFGSYFNGIYLTRLDPVTGKRPAADSPVTRLAFDGDAPLDGGEEAPYLCRHGGYYYLFVNRGQCCEDLDSTYRILVGRSASVTGPFRDRSGVKLTRGGGTVFLESVGRWLGPGHAGIFEHDGAEWLSHHYYDANQGGIAKLGLVRLAWTDDGWPAVLNDWSIHYPFDADARDSTDQYDGSLQRGAAVTTETGAGGPSLELAGAGQFVRLPLAAANGCTFAAWVKWDGGRAWQRIFDFGADDSTNFFLTPKAGNGKLRFSISPDGSGTVQNIDAPAALSVGSWRHVAVTLDGAQGVLYVDGSLVAANPALTTRPWQILARRNYLGKSQFATDPAFRGRIASFRVFGRALSAAEIKELFSARPAAATSKR